MQAVEIGVERFKAAIAPLEVHLEESSNKSIIIGVKTELNGRGRILGGVSSFDGTIWLTHACTFREAFLLGWDGKTDGVDVLAAHERIEWQREFTEKYPPELWPVGWREEEK